MLPCRMSMSVCPCPFCMSMSVLHDHFNAACLCLHAAFLCYVHASCPFSKPIPHVHAASSYCLPCCMSMLHVRVSTLEMHDACPCCLSMLHVHAAFLIFVPMLLVNAASPCCMFTPHVLAACPNCMFMLHVHVPSTLHFHHLCPFYMPVLQVHAACPNINALLCFYYKMGGKLYFHVKNTFKNVLRTRQKQDSLQYFHLSDLRKASFRFAKILKQDFRINHTEEISYMV
jgi:hypothetical protein